MAACRHPGELQPELVQQARLFVETRDGAIHARLGSVENPDATLAGPPRLIMGLLLGLVDLAGAKASGITYQGDSAILDRIGSQIVPTVAAS